MQVTISGQHIEITDIFRECVRRKLTRIDRHFGPVIGSHVVLHVTENRHRVETTVHAKGKQWHAAARDKNMYAAINRVVDKLDRQAIRRKEESSTTIKKRAD